ncbi:class I SAM-dependent methyltransferase [Maribacter halichondriae]|uniref:class I SAM-dependent methyltransferase n=1 Tax=Maribacter halichondriae TaxID=2980554 RepID=UPI00307653FE
MNKNILKTGVQNFIEKSMDADIVSVLFKKPIFELVSNKELVQQIQSKAKCKKKLPRWYNTPKIYYPKVLNIEQASSESTAVYKSEIVSGNSLCDLSGGFGIDSFFFDKKMETVVHCEIDKELSQIATYNFSVLGAKNIRTIADDGIEFLKKEKRTFDWIYIDPSRRNHIKEKVFKLKDCLPNVPDNLDFLFQKSSNLMLKTSPLLDIEAGLKELKHVLEIHVVALHNEVKELLWVLKKGFKGEAEIKTVNIKDDVKEIFNINISKEKKEVSKFLEPLPYLYEPNVAILKAGAFKSVGHVYELYKLHQHTHLYTSEKYIEFPGRRFKIDQVVTYSKKTLKNLGSKRPISPFVIFP